MSVFQKDDKFDSFEILKLKVAEYSATKNVSHSVARSERDRVSFVCRHDGCTWKLLATKNIEGDVRITRVVEHTCSPANHAVAPDRTAHMIARKVQGKRKLRFIYIGRNIHTSIYHKTAAQNPKAHFPEDSKSKYNTSNICYSAYSTRYLEYSISYLIYRMTCLWFIYINYLLLGSNKLKFLAEYVSP